MKHVVVLVLLMLLCGCETYRWERPGTSEEETRQELGRAQLAYFRLPRAPRPIRIRVGPSAIGDATMEASESITEANDARARQENFIRAWMASKGYRLVVVPAQRSGASSTP
jgi:hypothetical protein